MTYKAIYLDGQVAKRHHVELTLSGNLLVIGEGQGNCLATWIAGDIYPVDKVQSDQTLVLAVSGNKQARLYIDEAETRHWLNNILPGLVRRSDYSRESALAWKLSLGLVGVLGLFYFAFPWLVESSVKLIPLETEIEMFQGAGKGVATSLGGKKQCSDPAGVKVLQDLVHRLVGDEQAALVKVMVVDAKMENAFAVPGQEVVLLQGLIKGAKTGNEVVGVLAHELGHVAARHPMQAAVRNMGVNVMLAALSGGQIMEVAAFLAETSYSRDQEREADEYALAALRANNISSKGLANFFSRLDKDNHDYERWLKFVSTHPMSEERAQMMLEHPEGDDALNAQDWQNLQNICRVKTPL